jgi:putative membrane protein
MALLIRWLVPFLGVLLASYLLPEGIMIKDLTAAAIFAFVLAIVNAVIRPLVQLLSLPLTCLTLGLFHFVVNAAMFALAALFVPGVTVNGFWPAFVGALAVSAVGLGLSWVLPDRRPA